MKKLKYFRVHVEKVTAAPFYNLYVERLVKKKEALASGFAPHDAYRRCCEIRGVSERDAECITMALENPRPPLKKGMEKRHWTFKLKKAHEVCAGNIQIGNMPKGVKSAKTKKKAKTKV